MTEAVPAVMLAARLDEAARILALAVVTLVPTAARVEPSDVEAFVMLVLAVLTFVAIEPSDEPREVEALSIFVLAVVTPVPTVASVAPSDVEAVFVLLLIEVTAPETCEFVLALMFAASEVEAVLIANQVNAGSNADIREDSRDDPCINR